MVNKLSEKKNLFLIKDSLEKYIDFMIFDDPEINFFVINYDELPDFAVKKEVLERENNLLVLNEEFLNDKIRNNIKKIFLSKYKIANPHILFINLNQDLISNQSIIDIEQNFFYHLPNSNDKKHESITFYFFIRMIFQRMRDISRLDNYIINSFKTIIDSEIMKQQKQEIEKLYAELEALSKMDYLTKVLNRKTFFEVMDMERNRTLRNYYKLIKLKHKIDNKKNISIEDPTNNNISKVIMQNTDPLLNIYDYSQNISEDNMNDEFINSYGKFSCAMIDIDHFKIINDTYGHVAGDQVLKKLGELLKNDGIFRDNDIIGRYGGEEFIIVLPCTDVTNAKIPVERLRKQIREITFYGNDNNFFNVNISIGISEFKITDKSNEELINRADKALYYAKQNGKDQTVIYEEVF
jgi:diguanylate cyclase (GGDEF)-like protein